MKKILVIATFFTFGLTHSFAQKALKQLDKEYNRLYKDSKELVSEPYPIQRMDKYNPPHKNALEKNKAKHKYGKNYSSKLENKPMGKFKGPLSKDEKKQLKKELRNRFRMQKKMLKSK